MSCGGQCVAHNTRGDLDGCLTRKGILETRNNCLIFLNHSRYISSGKKKCHTYVTTQHYFYFPTCRPTVGCLTRSWAVNPLPNFLLSKKLVAGEDKAQGGGGMWKLHQHSQFFFQPQAGPLPPLIGYNFPTIHVFSQFLHKKRSFSIHSEIVFILHFVPVELMMTFMRGTIGQN